MHGNWVRAAALMLSMAALLMGNAAASQLTVSTSFTPNSVLDGGQYINFTAYVGSTGVAPFTYNFMVYNSITGSVVANALYKSVSARQYSFVWQVPSYGAGNELEANVIITDSASNVGTAPFTSYPYIQKSVTLSGFYGGAVAFSPTNGIAYVAATQVNLVDVINTSTGTVVNAINIGGRNLQNIAFNPSGTLAYVSISQSPEDVNVINTATNTVVNTIEGFTGDPEGIVVNPSGTTLYVITQSGYLSAVNTLTNTIVNTLNTGSSSVQNMAISPSGALVYVPSYSGGSMLMVNTITNTVVNTVALGSGSEPYDVAVNPSGSLAYVADYGTGYLSVVNTVTNAIVNTINVGLGPSSIVINPSGSFAYVTNYDGTNAQTVNVVNLATNTIANTIPVGYAPLFIAINPSGSLAYATNGGGESVWIIPINSYITANPQLVVAPLSPQNYNGIDASQALKLTANIISGQYGTAPYTYNFLVYNSVTGAIVANALYRSVSSTSNIFVWNVPAYAEGNTVKAQVVVTDNAIINQMSTSLPAPIPFSITNIISTGQPAAGIALSPSGNLAYLTITSANEVEVVNTITNSIVNTIGVGWDPKSIAITPTGSLAYVVNYLGNTISVVNLASNTVVNTIFVGGVPQGVAINPSGTFAYVGIPAGSGAINVISIASNAVVNTITVGDSYCSPDSSGFSLSYSNIALSPSGNTIYLPNYCADTLVVANAISNTIISYTSTGTGFAWQAEADPNGASVFVINYDTNQISVVNTTTYALANKIIVGRSQFADQFGLAFNPSGSLAYVVDLTDDAVGIINTTSYTLLNLTNTHTSYAAIAADYSGNNIYLTNPFSSTIAKVSTMPSMAVNPPLATPVLSATNTVSADAGQLMVFNATVSGGTAPYTYNYLVYNSVTGSLIAKALYKSISTGANSFAWYISYPTAGNTVYANVLVTDSAPINMSSNSIHTAITTINSILSMPLIAPFGTQLLDAGQSITFNAVFSGGTYPLTANWIVYNTITRAVIASMLFTGISSTSNSFNWNVPSYAASNAVAVQVNLTDSANTITSSLSVAPSPYIANVLTMAGQPFYVGTNPSGSLLYVLQSSIDAINVINATTFTSVNIINVGRSPQYIAFNPSGTLAYVAENSGTTINVINVTTNSIVNTISVGEEPQYIIFNPSGSLAYVSMNPGTVNVVNTATNSLVNTIVVGGEPLGMAADFSRNLVYVAIGPSGVVNVINVTTGTVVNTLDLSPSGYPVFSATLNSSMTTLFVSGFYGVYAVNTLTNTVVQDMSGIGTSNSHILFNPSGSAAYVLQYFGALNTITPGGTVTNTIVLNCCTGGYPHLMTMNPQNTMIYIPASEGTVTAIGINAIIGVNSRPTLTITSSNSFLQPGQYETFNITESGGTGPFNVLLYNVSGSKQQGGNVIILSAGGSNTITFQVNGTGTFVFNAIATDEGTTQYLTFNSVNASITSTQGGGTTTVPCTNGCYSGSGGSGSGQATTTVATTTVAPTTTANATTTVPAQTTTAVQSTTTVMPSGTVSVTQQNATVTVNVSSSQPYEVSYIPASTSFVITSQQQASVNFTVSNATSSTPPPPSNYTKLLALNVSSNSTANTMVYTTIHYPCSLPPVDVAPFILQGGKWVPIIPFTVDSAACTVSFSIPSDPIVSLMEVNQSKAASSTTLPPQSTSTVAQRPSQPTPSYYWYAVAAIIVAAAAFLAYRELRYRKEHPWHR